MLLQIYLIKPLVLNMTPLDNIEISSESSDSARIGPWGILIILGMSFGYAGLKAMSNIPSGVFNASISRALQQKGIGSFQQAAELRDCVIRILEAEAPGVIPDIESDDTLTKYIKYMPMVGMGGTYTAAIVDASQICIDKTMKTLTDRQDFVG